MKMFNDPDHYVPLSNKWDIMAFIERKTLGGENIMNYPSARDPKRKSESITEKCIWETSKKKEALFYMTSSFNSKKRKRNHA